MKKRSIIWRLVGVGVALAVAGGIAAGAAAGVLLARMDRTPREWAPYLQHRAQGHRGIIVEAVDLVSRWLIWADRIAPGTPPTLPASLGASVERSGAVAGRVTAVGSLAALQTAVAAAQPGDVIQIQPGRYQFEGYPIPFTRPGAAGAPITLRAARLGDVTIESNAVETFKVAAPFWRFENLTMRGVCADHTYCEHAIHVVGPATGVVIRNNRFEDYNAHIKINGEGRDWPDNGLISGNTFTESAPRSTGNPVTPIDLVGASLWRVSGNIIADFVRGGGETGATFGGFFKGAGEGNVFERNLVVCEWKLNRVPGEHVGLSLGGGGTGSEFRREQGVTGFEQIGGVIRDNLIAFCSDDGIYVNRSSRSEIDHNTVLDTAGIDVRFVESSATVSANIVDGTVRTRDGGSLRSRDNALPFLPGLFFGWHPERGYYRDVAALDLAWKAMPAALPDAEPRVDLCGHVRSTEAVPGAFADYAACSGGQ